jgi:hypothetical protein
MSPIKVAIVSVGLETTGSPVLAKAAGIPAGAGVYVVDADIFSLVHSIEFSPATGVAPKSVAFVSIPLRPACDAMTNAASGLLMLPPLMTVPLASVKVIEPTEFGSASHPGVTDAEAARGPTAEAPVKMTTASNGASDRTSATVTRAARGARGGLASRL